MQPAVSPILIPLAGIGLTMVIVPIALLAKHLGRARQYRHMERMQALKAGLTPPSIVPLPGQAAVVAIAVGVPLISMLGALAGTILLSFLTRNFLNHDLTAPLAIVWTTMGFLGACGLAAGLVLGLLLHRANAREAETARDASAKPAAYDPDMFDAVHRDH